MTTTKVPSIYGVHPGVARQEQIIAKLQPNTGKTLEQWVRLARAEKTKTERECAKLLKQKHGLGGNQADIIAQHAHGNVSEYNPLAYVEEMYASKKAGLRPIYDELLSTMAALGNDVEATPCKTFVSIRRKRVFAQIKPTTQTRIDLGLALGDTPANAPLIDTGGLAKGDRITHRIPIESLSDIDKTVNRWIARAYERDG